MLSRACFPVLCFNAFLSASLGCDNDILWIITAVQSLINVCKTLRSSDEVCCVHPVQHIIANKHRLFLIPAATHSWCFSYHTYSHMRMAMMDCAKVQLSHYLVSRNSRCLRKKTAKMTDDLPGKPSWLLAANILKICDPKVTSRTCLWSEFLSLSFQLVLCEPGD